MPLQSLLAAAPIRGRCWVSLPGGGGGGKKRLMTGLTLTTSKRLAAWMELRTNKRRRESRAGIEPTTLGLITTERRAAPLAFSASGGLF